MKLPHSPAPRRVSSRLPRALAACAVLLPLGSLPAHASTPKDLNSAQAAVDQLPPSATLRKIAENGAIVLGTRESSVPFSYLNCDQDHRLLVFHRAQGRRGYPATP